MTTGTITFPGIVAPIRMVATRTVGTKPDKAIIYAQPQDDSPDCTGTATLTFGFNGINVEWTDALCDKGTKTVSARGHISVFEIKDRRWKWGRAYLTKAYNVRFPDGSIDPATDTSLADIVSDLFSHIGESPDTSEIATGEKPELILDHDRCVDVVEEILSARGFVVSLLTDNTVKIYQRGVGATLPDNTELVTVNMSVDPPEPPATITLVGDKTLCQTKLLTEAVGLDNDGMIKAVDDLSYAPSGGWDGVDFENFAFITDPVDQELAKRSVGKWYQIVSQADGTQNINFGGTNYVPGEISVTDAWQLLPLEPKLLEAGDDIFGRTVEALPYVEGTFWNADPEGNPPQASNTADFTRVDRRDWTLQRELGIVVFRELALKKTPGPVAGDFTFADVYLTCSYSVNDDDVYSKDRYERSVSLGGVGEDQREVKEFQRQIILSYNDDTPDGVTDNKTTLDSDADDYLNAAANDYSTTQANVLLYRGIALIDTDGVALQVRWDCAVPGPVPFGTHVAQATEGLAQLPTRFDRSLIRRVAMTDNAINRQNSNFHSGRRKLRP